ncbi:hypothetical protein D3C72_1590270 [compost metagenome]
MRSVRRAACCRACLSGYRGYRRKSAHSGEPGLAFPPRPAPCAYRHANVPSSVRHSLHYVRDRHCLDPISARQWHPPCGLPPGPAHRFPLPDRMRCGKRRCWRYGCHRVSSETRTGFPAADSAWIPSAPCAQDSAPAQAGCSDPPASPPAAPAPPAILVPEHRTPAARSCRSSV